MFNAIKDILFTEGITRVGILPLDECEIINQRILPPESKSVIIFCIPYRSTDKFGNDGFSEYARVYDYHKYSTELYSRTITKLSESTNYFFKGFCDHSPINEKIAAAKCGLGVIGMNSLFIDDRYGSFVFLGSILTDFVTNNPTHPVRHCFNCGKCYDICPGKCIEDHKIDRSRCLSAISQKKSKSETEKSILKNHNIVWGCDICQIVCPLNTNAEISPIPYFKNSRLNTVNKKFIEELTDEEFNKYAFSYKGRKIVLDNMDFVNSTT